VTDSVLQRGDSPISGKRYLTAELKNVWWGCLPNASAVPVLEVDPGAVVTIDTVSHEGLLADQGRDPLEFFGRYGVGPSDVLGDAVAVTRDLSGAQHDHLGPHVVTGPIAVRGVRPGDVLVVEVLELRPRVPYGIISNRHGHGALPGGVPRERGTVARRGCGSP
jgi:acetamidase/formamidase